MNEKLTHLDASGATRMVDVGEKPTTRRRAVAQAVVRINSAFALAIGENRVAKGNVVETARLAGIQAAKRTAELVPLCHPLPLDHVRVDADLEPGCIRIRTEVCAHWKTGVEMEALTAAAVAALTVVDMGKSVDPGMVIEDVCVLEKAGGRRGHYRRSSQP